MTKNSSANTGNYLKAFTNTLGDILGDDYQFSIPYNQRPWSWRNDKLENLWRDICSTRNDFYDETKIENSKIWVLKPHNNAINPHFFGAFVFVEINSGQGSPVLEVVDGQQRLTSLVMISSILKELSLQLFDEANEPKQRSHSQKFSTLIEKWISRQSVPIINADEQFKQLFDSLVVIPTNDKDRVLLIDELPIHEKNTKEHDHLRKSFYFIRSLILKDFSNRSWESKLNFLKTTHEVIEKFFIAITTYIVQESFSYRVFTALNAKGQILTPIDNIKSELFNRSKIQLHQSISAEWRKLKSVCLRGDVGDFIRKRHSAVNGSLCSPKNLYQIIVDKELSGPKSIDQVLAEWFQDAKQLNSIINTHGLIGIDSETQEIIKALDTLGVNLSEILIIKAAKVFLPSDKLSFKKIVRLTLNFAFRKITIEGAKTSELDKAYTNAAKALNSLPESIGAVEKIFQKMSNDNDFKTAFSTSVQTNTKIQYYILYNIEKYISGSAGSGLQPYPHSVSQHIEHILPKNLSGSPKRLSEWQWAKLKPDDHKSLINRIGNLLILEAPINKQVSNHSFRSKQTGFYLNSKKIKPSYKDSGLKLALDLSSINKYPDWTKKSIEDRQAELSEYALKIWHL